MKLYDIQEPSKKPKQENNLISVGIDLGTTNSLIGYVKDENVQIISDDVSKELFVPSVVSYSNNEVRVGRSAIDAVKGEKVFSVKRLMGKGKQDSNLVMGRSNFKFSDSTEELKLILGKNEFTPVEISSEILKYLKDNIESATNKKVGGAVITVPAHFDDAARQATKDAAALAGIKVLRLINEPTAAAFAYGVDNKAEGVYAVYDLGGGTFDVTILSMQGGIFQVLSTGGDAEFGGDDLDSELLEYIFSKYKHKDLTSESDLQKVLLIIREIKERLSFEDSVTTTIPYVDSEIVISKEEFEKIISEKIESTIKVLSTCIKDAEIEKHEIKELILVGGSTRLPIVKRKLYEYLGKEPLDTIDPDKIVAIGASIQAHALSSGKSDNLLLDVTPLSLGIEVANGLIEKIIYRNSPIPSANTKTFTTQKEGQSGFIVHVLQGESDEVRKCRSLAKFEIKGIPTMNAGDPRLEIKFQLDADGILSVEAKELISGIVQTVEVKPTYGLTEEKVLSIIKESL